MSSLESLPAFVSIIDNNLVKLMSLNPNELITPFEDLYPLSFAISLNRESLTLPLIQKLKSQSLLSETMVVQALDNILDFSKRNPEDNSYFSIIDELKSSWELRSLTNENKSQVLEKLIGLANLSDETLSQILFKFENPLSSQTFKKLVIHGRRNLFLNFVGTLETLSLEPSVHETLSLHDLAERGMADCLPQLYPLIDKLSVEEQITLFSLKNSNNQTFLHSFVLYNPLTQDSYKTIFKGFIEKYKSQIIDSGILNFQDIFGSTVAHNIVENGSSYNGVTDNFVCVCVLKKLKEAGASFYIKNSQGKMVITMDKIDKCLLNDLSI